MAENFASYRIKPERPAQQPQGGYSEDALTKYANSSIKAHSKFLLTQMFRAAAPENVRQLISHIDQTRHTAEDAYNLFFSEHRVEMDRKSSAIHAMEEEQPKVEPEQEIMAFHLQQHQQPYSGQQNSRYQNKQNNSSNKFNQGRSNSSRSSSRKFCVYCQIMTHSQQECWKHIKDDKLCMDYKGKYFWPKLNASSKNGNSPQAHNESNDPVGGVFNTELNDTPH